MPVLPAYLTEALWGYCEQEIPVRKTKPHPLGCHRGRVPDRVAFDHLLVVFVLGATYQQAASKGCSATTIRRWRDEMIGAKVGEIIETKARALYSELVGLKLNHLAIDGCIAKSPCGGQIAGKSPVDRAKMGYKRSLAVDARGIPLATILAPANVNDSNLLAPTLEQLDRHNLLPKTTVLHLDKGYRGKRVALVLKSQKVTALIVEKWGQDRKRWVVERTNSWHNSFGKLRRSTERRKSVLAFFIALANAIILLRSVIHTRWPQLAIGKRSCCQ